MGGGCVDTPIFGVRSVIFMGCYAFLCLFGASISAIWVVGGTGRTKPCGCDSVRRTDNLAGDALGLLVAGWGRILDGNLVERRPKIPERGYHGNGLNRARIGAERDVESSRVLGELTA